MKATRSRKGEDRTTRRRAIWLAIGLTAWAALVAGRLVELQAVRREAFVERARRQQERTVEVEAPRGRVLDRAGRTLAESIEVPSLYADPRVVEDAAAAAKALAPILGQPAKEIGSELISDRGFVWLARRVDPETARRARDLGLDGLGAVTESRRFYPGGRLAAHVLGMVGVDGVGLGGVEYRYDDLVRGRPGKMLSVQDAHGVGVLMYLERPSSSGRDLRLTLAQVIQYHAEVELDRAMRKTGSTWGSVVVMDPVNGAILAMANRPSFNPNAYSRTSPEVRRNRAVTDAYEPGSTFKLVTAAAALERDLVDVHEVIDCGRGSVVVSGHRIRDHKPFDLLSFADVIAESSNVGAIHVGSRVPANEFHDTITAFGFGTRTGVGLPGENNGLLRPPSEWSGISQASMSIGQELSATPLQVLRMAAAVANDGVLPQPYIVDGDAPAGKRVISEAAATTLGLLLERVVTHGTGKAARIPGYRVAGKTGTAQKAVPSGGYGEEHVASFVGYVPARRPALAMVVVLDSPQGLYHGGDVAAPVFARVALPALRHLGILPDEGAIDAPPARPAPILTAAAPRRAAPPLRRTGDGDPVVPDLAGATLRAALARLARAGLSARADGNGRVVGQDPPPGQVLPRGAMVRLLLKEPAPAANAAPGSPGRNGSRAGAR